MSNCDKILDFYNCQKCDFTSIEKIKTIGHICNVDVAKNRLTTVLVCRKCNFQSYSHLYMFSHKKICRKKIAKKWYECDQCSYKSLKVRNLRAHLKSHERKIHLESSLHNRKTNKTVMYVCDYCPYKSFSSLNLSFHVMGLHKGDVNSWFECDKCSFRIKSFILFCQHQQQKHPPPQKWFKCDQCSHKSLRIPNLRRHIISKHTDEHSIEWKRCDKCSFRTKHLDNLKKHYLKQHKQTFRHCI